MKILVYGAGPLGCLFAARLHEAGHDVFLLARGEKAERLRRDGLALFDEETKTSATVHPRIVERLDPDDAYDLVLVVMRRNRVEEILPALAAARKCPDIMFLMNNFTGPAELEAAVGKGRVLFGFPMSAGYWEDGVLHYMGGSERREAAIPLGEPDGSATDRTRRIAAVLAGMRGYKAEIRTDMDAWLKSHAAVLMPGLGAAIYGAALDNVRLARTRDLIVLGLRATREAIRVLKALGIPLVPKSLAMYTLLPEALLVSLFMRRLADPAVKVGLVGHAVAARDEISYHADAVIAAARAHGVPIPNIERLRSYIDVSTTPMSDGSAQLPVKRGGVVLLCGTALAVIAGIILLIVLAA